MENDVAQAKHRILREAIRSNVEVVRSGRVKPKASPGTAPPLSLCGSLLVASVAYLAVPSLVVSRGKEPSSRATGVDTTKAASVDAEVMKAAVPLSTPSRLTRAVLPLTVKR